MGGDDDGQLSLYLPPADGQPCLPSDLGIGPARVDVVDALQQEAPDGGLATGQLTFSFGGKSFQDSWNSIKHANGDKGTAVLFVSQSAVALFNLGKGLCAAAEYHAFNPAVPMRGVVLAVSLGLMNSLATSDAPWSVKVDLTKQNLLATSQGKKRRTRLLSLPKSALISLSNPVTVSRDVATDRLRHGIATVSPFVSKKDDPGRDCIAVCDGFASAGTLLARAEHFEEHLQKATLHLHRTLIASFFAQARYLPGSTTLIATDHAYVLGGKGRYISWLRPDHVVDRGTSASSSLPAALIVRIDREELARTISFFSASSLSKPLGTLGFSIVEDGGVRVSVDHGNGCYCEHLHQIELEVRGELDWPVTFFVDAELFVQTMSKLTTMTAEFELLVANSAIGVRVSHEGSRYLFAGAPKPVQAKKRSYKR